MKALVIGGGIGGLAAGVALKQIGHEVSVFERAHELGEVGSGISLWSNGVNALKELKVDDALRQLSRPGVVEGSRPADGSLRQLSQSGAVAGFRSANGKLLVELSIRDLQATDPPMVVHRADLHNVLLEEFGREHVRLNAQCTGFEDTPEGVTAHFADQSEAQGDYLIGADGIHSAIRAQIHGRVAPRYTGYTAWRGIASFDLRKLLPGITWGSGARFGQAPLADGRVYWFGIHNEPQSGSYPTGEKDALLRIFAGWHEPIEALILATDETSILRNDVFDRPVLKSWGSGRVNLLGDAAHAMAPSMGQGACQAFEDAVVLSRCLRTYSTITEAFREYEMRRIPRVNPLVKQSRRIGEMGRWSNPIAIRVRNMLMKRAASRFSEHQRSVIDSGW